MRRTAVTILFACLTFINTELSASNYADTYGISAKSMGMANAVTATVNDWSSLWYNPAGLGKTYTLPRYKQEVSVKPAAKNRNKKAEEEEIQPDEIYPSELALVVMYTEPMMKIKIPRAGVYADKDLDFGMSTVGVVMDCNTLIKMPEYVSSARFGLAVGTGLGGWMYNVTDTSPISHNYLRYGREAQRTIILGGIGLGFLDDLFGLGAGVNIQNRIEAQSIMHNVLLSPNSQQPMTESKMSTYVEPFLTAGFYVSPEKITPVLKGLELGMGYRMATEMKTAPFRANSNMMAAGITIPIDLAIYDFYSPNIISTGIAYTKFNITASFNLDYEMWSGFNLGPNYKNGYMYYEEDAIIDPVTGLPVIPPLYAKIPSMQDIIVYRLGFSIDMEEYISWLTLLCGYYYQPSFIPDSAVTGDMNFLDNDKHVLSIGAVFDFPKTWRFGGPVELSIAYQYQYLTERKVHKTNLQASTAQYNPDYTYGGMCHTITMGVGIKI